VDIIDPFIEAMIQQESSGHPKAISKQGARGLMQIMPGALKEFNKMNKKNYSMDNMFNPNMNKEVGTWYVYNRIPQMLEHFKLPITPENMLASYNGGIGNVRKNKLPEETQKYVPAIMNRFHEMSRTK
jgi:soluble lytic murein transglycosylase